MTTGTTTSTTTTTTTTTTQSVEEVWQVPHPKVFIDDGGKILLFFGSDQCQADPIFKVVPFQINRTRFSPPTITQKGDEELYTKKLMTADI